MLQNFWVYFSICFLLITLYLDYYIFLFYPNFGKNFRKEKLWKNFRKEKGYYLVLILNIEDDADEYESGMADILRVILQNLEDDSYIQMIPSLFSRLAVYPSLNNEQHLAITYQDDVKRMILNSLRDEGAISKSELMVWLKDTYQEGFFDLEDVLTDLIKKGIIKQTSIKGMISELNFLVSDLIMLRVPPMQLVENIEKSGLPAPFVENYLHEVKEFFKGYRPTEADNVKMVDALINTQVYQTLRLLRTAIVTESDLAKLKQKGVDNISSALKSLWEPGMIKIFKDKGGIEYFALISDFYIEMVFPKYLLGIIKNAYEQKSKGNSTLIEYLNVLEETYLALKSGGKLKEKQVD